MKKTGRWSRMDLKLVGTAIIFGLPIAPCFAQTMPGSPPNNTTAATDTLASGDGQAGAATSSSGVEDIVVTAQRRNELQQNVPISISTLTSATAARIGVTGTESLGIAVPALQFSRQTGNGGTPFLRGVGTTQGAAGAEFPVALYVDDVYVGAASATLLQFNNIASTEVLKGPQGTLFGRNATGGVVNIHTKRPSHNQQLDAAIGGGSYGTYFGNLYATGGVSDTVAVSLAAAGQNQSEGYGRNFNTGEKVYKSFNYGVRGQLLWTPGVDTTVLLTADWSRNKGDQGMNVVLAPGTVAIGGSRPRGRFIATSDPADFADNRNWGVSGRIEHDFDAVSLVSITAYRNSSQIFKLDADGSLPGAPPIIDILAHGFTRTFSQEVQLLSGQDGPFKWIVGGFYYTSTAGYNPQTYTGLGFAGLGGASVIDDKQDLNSISGFGEASYELPSRTKLTLGVRYTNDRFHLNVTQLDGSGAVRAGTPYEARDSFGKLTYRAILDQKLTDDILAYGSYSRGFKSGGYNLSGPSLTVGGVLGPAPVVEPEILDAFELGFKSQFFDRKVRLNLSVFHYDYKNLQVTSVQNSTSITLNAARARLKGLDVDLNYVPNRRVNLGAAFSFLDSRFNSFPSGPYFVPNPASCATLSTTGPLVGGNTTCVADLSGNRTSRAPKLTMSLTAAYTLPTSAGDFTLSTSLYHNSGFYWEPDNRYKQKSYDLLNGTLTWTSPDEKYEVRLYARNLLNKYYYSYFSESTGRDSGSPEMPRSFGGSIGVHF